MNFGKTVNALKNKVLETVQTTSKPKFISEDENFNLLYEKYSRLGIFENQLNNLVRDSVSSIQKSTQANKELSVFLQMTMEGQLRDCFDIGSITEKFCNLQNSIASAQFNDFMSNTQQQFLKPIMRDIELDQQLQIHLEGRVIDERLVEMLTLRAEERTITLSQVILALMESQYNYYTTIATLYADLHGELGPMMTKMAGRKAGNAKPNSPPPQHHQQPPAKPPTQSNIPPATQSAPQNGARARGNSATPPPSHNRPPVTMEPPKPEPPTVTTNIFVDDFLTAPSATKATSREAIFSFDDTPATHAPPLNPTNNDFFSTSNNNKNSYFDDFETLAPQKMNGNKSNGNSNGFDPFGGFSGGNNSNNYFGGNTSAAPPPKSTSGLDDLNWGSAPPKSSSPIPNNNPSALQDKIDRDRHHQQEQDARRHFDVLISEKVDAWANNKKGNLRALLANLHQIIYEDSGWTEAPLSELVQPGALKKVYRKAMLVVHPDKTAGKSLETRLLAERLFATLQEAAKTAQWN